MSRIGTLFLAFAFVPLCGCGSASTMLNAGGPPAIPGAVTPVQTASAWTMVSLAPISGVTPAIADQIARRLTQSALRNNAVVRVDGSSESDLELRGYLMLDQSKGPSKILYVWDLLDKSGNRVNRAAGEQELNVAANPAAPWDAVMPGALDDVADKAAAMLARGAQPAAAPANPPSGVGLAQASSR